MKRLFALLLAAAMMLALFAGCGGSGSAVEPASGSEVSEVSEQPSSAPVEEDPAAPAEDSAEPVEIVDDEDFTEANANMDFSG